MDSKHPVVDNEHQKTGECVEWGDVVEEGSKPQRRNLENEDLYYIELW
jgi:hypothetical protein